MLPGDGLIPTETEIRRMEWMVSGLMGRRNPNGVLARLSESCTFCTEAYLIGDMVAGGPDKLMIQKYF